MPTLNWIGKDKILTHHQDVPFHVLEHRYGFTAEGGQQSEETGSGNMIIHGDNLMALKSLLPKYEGKIDCIYIDPPYNTGEEKWVYNDNVNDPHIRKWLNEVVGKEGEDLSRHDKWVCMMYPRLVLMQRLLSDKGVIFISLDDNEVASLKFLCNEIFGSNCFVADIIWQKTYSPRNDSKGIPTEIDHTLVYGKYPGWQPKKLERTEEMNSNYKNPDNDFALWRNDNPCAPGAASHQGMVYAIQHPFTGKLLYPYSGSCWRYEQPTMLNHMQGWCEYELRELDDAQKRAEVCGISADVVRQGVKAIMLKEPLEISRAKAQAVYDQGPWPKFFFTSGGQGGIGRKTYLTNVDGKLVTNLWHHADVGHTDEATKELKEIFGGKSPFDTPKPSRLIERILQIATDEDSIILDSFAGSGTTMHAALRLNKKDKGNRKVILVEMLDYAESITAERVRRVIAGYKFSGKKKDVLYSKKLTATSVKKMPQWIAEADAVARFNQDLYDKFGRSVEDNTYKLIGEKRYDGEMPGLGGAFDYYELGEPLFDSEGFLNESVGVDRIREYVYYSETQKPLEQKPTDGNPYFLGSNNRTDYYFYYEPDRPTTFSIETLGIIKRRAEQYIVYADTCLFSKDELAAYGIIFKKIPRDIKKF